MLAILGELNAADIFTELQFPNGRVVRLPTTLLKPAQPEESFEGTPSNQPDQIVVPLIEEQLEVSKRTVATGVVRLDKRVQAFDVTLDEPLAVVSWKVDRIAIGRVVEVAPPARQEGDMTIYPVLEEQLVLTKQLVLIEEVRVSREVSERRDTSTVTLRREHLDVQREELLAK